MKSKNKAKTSKDNCNVMPNKDYKKEFIKCLESISYGSNSYGIFSDFLNLTTLSFENVFMQDKKIEKEFLNIMSKYKNSQKFAELLAITAMALEEKMYDFLGEIFIMLGFGNSSNGQFFTPFQVSEFMAKINIANTNIEEQIKQKGYITVSEPCCGGGGMIIALAKVLLEEGYNPQKVIRFQAIDVDLKCCQMTYIQTSLLGLKGEILYGNSLTLEVWKKFTTLMSYMKLTA